MAAALLADITEIFRYVLRDPGIELTSATRFDELSEWDSMYLIDVVVEIESRFDLLFETDEIETLHTTGDLLRMLAHKRALAAA
jgi:acyl carrier protein